jgi:RNA polymerase sigma-70 factor (ECF subfamily)
MAPGAVEFAAGETLQSADFEGEDTHSLRRCLDELETVQRDCIVLAYADGYTHDELAHRLQRPLGTIKSWIRRGLKRLKDCLER